VPYQQGVHTFDFFPYGPADLVAHAKRWPVECLSLVGFADEGAGLLVGADQVV